MIAGTDARHLQAFVHSLVIREIAFSPDDKLLASVSNDHRVHDEAVTTGWAPSGQRSSAAKASGS